VEQAFLACIEGRTSSAAEASIDLMALTARWKPRPFKTGLEIKFFRNLFSR